MRVRAPAILLLVCAVSTAQAGPFAPKAGEPGSTAIASTNPGFTGWATGWTNYLAGSNVVSVYQEPGEALGPANCDFDDPYNVCTLGNEGQITLTFAQPIVDTDGFDFAVFENSFDGTFLELAYVEVSADGTNFVRFPSASWTQGPVPFTGAFVDATNLDGLAGTYGGIWGQYGVTHGTPFDLADVGLDQVTHVRIIDIVGDGRCFDSVREWFSDPFAPGDPIYDPHPTSVTGGFDLDAVGVFVTRTYRDWALARFPYPLTILDASLDGKDPDGDGLVNLLEYAFATEPLDAASAQRPQAGTSGRHAQIMFRRDANKTDLTYIVETSGDLAMWTEIARSVQGDPMMPSGPAPATGVSEVGDGWLKQITVTDGHNLGNLGGPRFLRVRVTR
ncbi:MAG: hypothetical protein IAE97_05130 [Chthoniobacterales bacterium]|nr:hypothetical protein [Chthoniobacterales bacterium]